MHFSLHVLDTLAKYMHIKIKFQNFSSYIVLSEIFLNLLIRLKSKSGFENEGYSTLVGSITTFCPLPAPKISNSKKMLKKSNTIRRKLLNKKF